jgi:hypothetical protein
VDALLCTHIVDLIRTQFRHAQKFDLRRTLRNLTTAQFGQCLYSAQRTERGLIIAKFPASAVQSPIIYTVRSESQLETCIPDRSCTRFTSFPPQSKSLISTPRTNHNCFQRLLFTSYIVPFDAILCTKTLSLHKLTPWDSLFRERNYTSVNKFSAFCGTQSSLPCSQQPATCL